MKAFNINRIRKHFRNKNAVAKYKLPEKRIRESTSSFKSAYKSQSAATDYERERGAIYIIEEEKKESERTE